jgi:2-O-(6-phospho-alpha-D-mannosyl)-D-glycerate hydrolase
MAKKPKNKEIKLRGHFMPNSHLDREWTLDYQKTRRLTVEFLDSLLDIFEAIPQYTFLLDSQTVPIEDYLAIRPENEERLRSIIEQGRMSIGPWYTAPDCNTITGESIVRNLLVGDRTAKKYGNPMKTGYTPFGFGQISQMPQIYTGFDIDVMFFYRGINSQDCPESEFTWQSPDGTEILCSRFGSKSRYNFFMDVWRPVAYGRDWTYRFYDWDRGDIPFRRVSADEEMEHYFIQRPKMTLNREIVEDCFRTLVEVEKQHFTTPIIPFMQGMDTTRPHPLEAEIVEELQGLMDEGEELFFSTLDKYAAEMTQYVDRKKLRHFEGEMRHLGNPSPHVSGLEHILSGRIRQKTHQSKAERMLTRLAEPFAALTWAEGDSSYPKTYLDTAWKYLLKCHPHDTVAGCGIDKLETDATYRLDQVKSLSGIVFDDALASIITNVNTSKVDKNEIALTVFNPSPRVRTEVVDAYIDMTEGSGIVEYEVVEAETEKIADFTFVYRKPTEKTVRDNSDLTTALVGWMCKTQVVAKDIPAMGWKTYIVRKADPNGRRERIAQSPHRMENENLIVEVLPDSTLTVTDKNTGQVYSGLNNIVDEGENGNCWEYRAPGENRII